MGTVPLLSVMDFELVGQPAAGPTLDLDHEEFAYAGKFVMSSTGKTVARDDGTVVGAVAFNADHSESDALRLRYVTVRSDRRGEGIGSRLLRFTAETLSEESGRVLIAVNNPIAYQACYRAGFTYTGEETGIAEVLLAYEPDADRSATAYDSGLAVFDTRDLPPGQRAVVDEHRGGDPPSVIPVPE